MELTAFWPGIHLSYQHRLKASNIANKDTKIERQMPSIDKVAIVTE